MVGTSSFTVAPDGALLNEASQSLGTPLVTVPPEGAAIQKMPNGHFQLPQGEATVAAEGYSLVQGHLELSNVDMNLEMTKLIEAQRAFSVASSALQIVDNLNRKAVAEIGAIN